MISRLWTGRAGDGAEAYFRHVTTVVLPKLSEISGFRGGRVLRRPLGNVTEFLVITEWDSWAAIRAFAGDHPDVAVVEPQARTWLTDFDDRVRHFELAHAVTRDST